MRQAQVTSQPSFDPRAATFAELLDRSFFAAIANARLLAFYYMLPSTVAYFFSGILFRHSESADPGEGLGYFVLGLAVAVVPIVAASISTTEKMGNAYFGDALLNSARKRIAPFSISAIGTGLAFSIFVLLGLVALIIPGIWIYVTSFLLVPAIAFDRVAWLKAFSRSRDLLAGRKLRLLLPLVSFVVADVALDFGSTYVLGGDTPAQDILYAVLSSILNAYVTVVALFLYVDARTRKEGLDLDILASRVLRRAPAA